MIENRFILRDVVHDDFERITELTNLIEQEKSTVEDIRSRWLNKSRKQFRRVVLDDNQIIGYASCLEAITGGGGIYLLRVDIEPAYQRQGIGRELLELVESAARDLGARILTTKTRDDMDRERRFFEAAGFEAFQHLRGVTLALDTFSPPHVKTGTETLTTWAEIGDSPENRTRLYEVYARADADSPGVDVWGIPDFEGWQTGIFTSSWYRPEGLIVACEADEWVGLTILGPMEDDVWVTDYTGTVPEHRGKGVASRLKIAALTYAKEQGGKMIHTFNDDFNGPMRAINDKLGFVSDTGWWMYRKNP